MATGFNDGSWYNSAATPAGGGIIGSGVQPATVLNSNTSWYNSAATPAGGGGAEGWSTGGLMAPAYYTNYQAATAALSPAALDAGRKSFGDFSSSGMSWDQYLNSNPGSRDEWRQEKVDMANHNSSRIATEYLQQREDGTLARLQGSFNPGGLSLSQWQKQNGGTGAWADYLDSNDLRDSWRRYKIENAQGLMSNGGRLEPIVGGNGFAWTGGQWQPNGTSSNNYSAASAAGYHIPLKPDGTFAYAPARQTGEYSYAPGSYEAMQASAAQMAAQGLAVTPDMLVNNQLAGIMKSPVGQIAMDVAREQMTARGMLDSTAAQNAIIQAAITAGLPIAEADAQSYFKAAEVTMQAENAAREANMGAQNTQMLANQSAFNAAAAFNANASDTAVRYKLDATEAARLQNLDESYRQQVFQADNAYRDANMEMEDYWQKMNFTESQRQYNESLDLNAYQAETSRLQTDYQAASNDYQRRTAVMGMFERLWETDLSQGDAAKVATVTLETLGLPDDDIAEMLTTFVENYTTPEIVVSG